MEACLAVVLVGAAVCTVNALSMLDEAARDGEAILWWRPWASEYASLLGLIAALPVAVAAERLIHAGKRLLPRIAVLLVASAIFSCVHVATMVAARELLWWSLGRDYSFDIGRDWLYEYRKDAIGYGLALLFLALARRLPPRPSDNRAPGDGESCSFLWMGDGRRQVAVNLASLCAVRGGGNYVELISADGRRRLLRATLGASEAALAGHGFRRTHKSWLVRAGSVTALERTGAGDFRLSLNGGLEVPLSRRNRAVLDEIRQALSGDGPQTP